jgi:hypothetical protein
LDDLEGFLETDPFFNDRPVAARAPRWLSNPALPAILLRLDALAGKIDALINDAQLTGKT